VLNVGATAPPSEQVKRMSTNRTKGRLVEAMAAMLHEEPGVHVERNVRLRPPGYPRRRGREIDVLLTVRAAGYPIRLAVECKNESEPVGAKEIDAFVGKLHYVGIPPQLGIFIAATGYTRGALERAAEAGVRTLVLRGITPDRLATEVHAALQSVIYLLAEVASTRITGPVPDDTDERLMFWFQDATGHVCGCVGDLIWRCWMARQIPDRLGEHDLLLDVPDGWLPYVPDAVVTSPITARVRVHALVAERPGTAERVALVDAVDQRTERGQLRAHFERRTEPIPVKAISTEDQLRALLNRPYAAHLVIGRIPLPRILWNDLYWPPSERAVLRLREWIRAAGAPGTDERAAPTFADLEGTDLSTNFEAIWGEHPAMRGDLPRATGPPESDGSA
jgi:hypothetical protein